MGIPSTHPSGMSPVDYWFRFSTISTYTATTSTAPETTYCQAEGTFMICKPLVRLVMINDPIIAPKIVPAPPRVDVPPKMQAAIANSSYPVPAAIVPYPT